MTSNIENNQMINLYEIMAKWVSTSDNNDNNEYKEQVIDNETPELMNVTKKLTKEFSKNYQKVLKELTTENEIIMDNNNESNETNKGVSELIKGYMITYETNRTTRETIQHWYRYGQEFKEKLEEIKNGKECKIPDHIARRQLYLGIKNKGIEKVTLSTIKTRTQNSLKVYDLFSKIGPEKIDRIKNCSWNNLAKLSRPEIENLIKLFK